MKNTRFFAFLPIAAAFAFSFTSCEQQTESEEAADEMGDAIEESADDVGDSVEDAADDLDS